MQKILISILFFALAYAASSQEVCRSNDECNEDECCATTAFINMHRGHCKKLGEKGSNCTPLEKLNEDQPSMFRYFCPCKEGLNCVSDLKIEIFGHKVKYHPKCETPEATEESI